MSMGTEYDPSMETEYDLEWAIDDAKVAIGHLMDIAPDENLNTEPAINAFNEAIRQVEILRNSFGGEE